MELWRQYESAFHVLTAGLVFTFIGAVLVGILH
jgi:hypothetical protein